MLHISYNDNTYTTFFPRIAELFSAKFQQNRIELPSKTGKGHMEIIPLGDGIHAAINDYTLNEDIKFCRKKTAEPFFILHFDEMRSEKNFMMRLDGELMKTKGHAITGAMLTCSLFDLCYTLPANTTKRSINIILTKEWIKKYLNMGLDEDDICNNYFNLKIQHLNIEPFNAEYRTYFNQVFDTPEQKPMRQLHMRNAIMMLIEIYFSRLQRKVKAVQESPVRKMNTSDLYKLMEVENMLVKDFSKAPPTIVDLAAYTQMSVSKLKSSFKQVYGTGIYEYFQKNRMRKAKSMLSSHGYTIKEVGLQLGYTNLSNFSLAFKKEFGLLPSQLKISNH
ncbi:MAG: helix-turn-helix transcriptional regulator [Chitinophagaceae bacterium]|nr:helix-turn-helix transcriptional regulator [Chitinophagaceae bacterium]